MRRAIGRKELLQRPGLLDRPVLRLAVTLPGLRRAGPPTALIPRVERAHSVLDPRSEPRAEVQDPVALGAAERAGGRRRVAGRVGGVEPSGPSEHERIQRVVAGEPVVEHDCERHAVHGYRRTSVDLLDFVPRIVLLLLAPEEDRLRVIEVDRRSLRNGSARGAPRVSLPSPSSPPPKESVSTKASWLCFRGANDTFVIPPCVRIGRGSYSLLISK